MHAVYLPFGKLSSNLGKLFSFPRIDASNCWRAESFRRTVGEEMPVRRALALNRVLESCRLYVVPGELLAGSGNFARTVPAETIDQNRLNTDSEFIATIGERNFTSHANHHAGDYPKLLRLGFSKLMNEVEQSIPKQDEKGQVFLRAVHLALQGASAFAKRWASHLVELAEREGDFSAELRREAEIMEKIATDPPETFREALQLVYYYHCLMQLDRRGAMAFGRFDQYLRPFYEADLGSGRSSKEEIQDLLDHFFVKITLDEDVQNLTLGGTDPKTGKDASSELTLQVLEACRRVGRPGGNCTVRTHALTPQVVLEKCAEVIRTGIGYPAMVNEEPIIQGLIEHGYAREDARDYCCVGCIETQIPGKQAPWADGRANPLFCLNLALFRGRDSLTGKQLVEDPGEAKTYEEFYQQFTSLARQQIQNLVAAADAKQRPYFERAGEFTSPLVSALVDDCIARGRDMNDGGARYPGCFGFASMGIASLADSLMAIRTFVYEEKHFTLDELRTMLQANFVGFEAERALLVSAPKFGNDNDSVDRIAIRVVTDLAAEYRRYRTPEGGHYFILLGANVQNISAGKEVGATPDGRLAKTPLSDAASPTFGRDINGPTATLRSVAKLPYSLCVGGNVVNMKLDPKPLEKKAGLKRLSALIRSAFDLGAQELQFNTTGSETLRQAMETPDDYRGLVVRVSGFSATYTGLQREVQEDILARTEHQLN